jgi:hypothetical protein
MQRQLLVVTCAISAAIHAALVPQHLEEGLGPGLGFFAAALLLAGVTGAMVWDVARAAIGAAAVLGGLLVVYLPATTTGLPLLHPEPEPVTVLALVTKAIEAVGLLAALDLKGRR